jgi:trigger factor
VRQFPGQEQEVFNYFRNNPEAMAQIRAPLFENKVIDFVIAQADVTDITVSIEELMASPEEAEEKPKAKKKPAKKAPAKKAAAKKADTKEGDQKPAKKPAAKKPAAKKPAAKKPAAKKAPAKKKEDK